jgi:putative FmdB family regulatory protein
VPLYEYECRKCHHRFERIQQFSDKPVRRCPKCKTGRVEKLISSPAVHFKGTGWYVTDYGGKKSSGGDKSESGDKSDSGKSESGKSEGGKSEGGKSEGGKSEDKGASKGSSSKDASSKKSDRS